LNEKVKSTIRHPELDSVFVKIDKYGEYGMIPGVYC